MVVMFDANAAGFIGLTLGRYPKQFGLK
jgi:hypothetical protein